MARSQPGTFWRFLKDDKGSSTIEAVLWLPIFFALFGLMADTAMIFNGYSRVLRVIQDGNRNMSVGRLDTPVELENYVTLALQDLSPNATVASEVSAGVVTTTASIPAADLEILGMFSALNSLTIQVESQQYIEF